MLISIFAHILTARQTSRLRFLLFSMCFLYIPPLIHICNPVPMMMHISLCAVLHVYIEWRGPSAIFGPSVLLGTVDSPRELPTIHANGCHNGHQSHQSAQNGRPSATTSTPGGNAGSVAELEFQLRETEQLLEITLLKKKLRETETAMSNIIAQMGTVAKDQVSERIEIGCTRRVSENAWN